MLMRFDPFRDLDRLTQNLWGTGEVRRLNGVPMDAYRKGSEFVVHFDVPGIDPDTIELTVEKNVAERPVGSFSRQLFLGETLDSERIDATCENGVLTLRIPVAEAAKPRKVSITSGPGNGQSTAIPAQSTSN
jgi:HSP20 family protein